MKTKRIYKRSMAEFLVDFGCQLIRVVTDIADPSRLNWVFEDNDKLREGMTVYTRDLRA